MVEELPDPPSFFLSPMALHIGTLCLEGGVRNSRGVLPLYLFILLLHFRVICHPSPLPTFRSGYKEVLSVALGHGWVT
jgi:hypothetical protein